MEEQREIGMIASRKENFGFIKRSKQNLDIFFHVSEVDGAKHQFKPGTEVEYTVAKDPNSNRLLAKHVKVAPNGSFNAYSTPPRRYIGHLIRIDSSTSSSILVRYVEGNKPKLLTCLDTSVLEPGGFVRFKIRTDLRAAEAASVTGAKPYTYQKATEFEPIEDTNALPKHEALEVTILKLVKDYKDEIQKSGKS